MNTFATIQLASYTEAEWTAWTGILKLGQHAYSTDLFYAGTDQMRYKVGNGVDLWTALDYVPEGGQATTLFITARNTTGVTINKGQVVYINGATSSTPTIALARSNAETTSFDVGVASFSIPNNTNVANNVTIQGLLTGFDTSAFTAGDRVYVSSATAGALQNTPPASPNFGALVGHILYSHVTNGILLVAPAKSVISQNTSLGSSLVVSPSENAVKTYVDSKGSLIYLTSGNQTTTLNTAVNITELVYNASEVSKRYFFDGVFHIGCNNTGGVKLAITVPTGATLSFMVIGANVPGTSNQPIFRISTSGTLTTISFNNANAESMIHIMGEVLLDNTNTGNVQFQFASTTAGQTSTIYQQGTLLKVVKYPF